MTMTRVVVTEQIGVSADRLWRLLSDFGNIGWAPGGQNARTVGSGVGMVRIISAGGPEIHEHLEELDAGERRIVYSIRQGMPLPIKDYRATMRIRPAGDGNSELEWSCTFEPDGVTAAEAHTQVENLYHMMIGWVRDHVTRQ
jgi:hypothetical protein